MEKEEVRILQALGWNSKGLISVSADVEPTESSAAPLHGGNIYC